MGHNGPADLSFSSSEPRQGQFFGVPSVFKKVSEKASDILLQPETSRYRFIRGEALGKQLPKAEGKRDKSCGSVSLGLVVDMCKIFRRIKID